MRNLFKFVVIMLLFVVAGQLSAQDLTKLPSKGQKIELEGEARAIPTVFDLSDVEMDSPYHFNYKSEGQDVFNFNLLKNDREIQLSGIDKNATIDFFNGGELVGSFPGSDFPAVTNGGVAIIIIAAIVVACCVKVKYKRTVTNPNGTTTTTWEVSWDCNCLSIELKNAMPKINIRGREIAFDRFEISYTNKPVRENNLQLLLSH